MIEAQEGRRHCLLLLALIFSVNEHSDELPRVHVKLYDVVLNTVELDVLPHALDGLGVEIVGQHPEVLNFHCGFDGLGSYSAKHIAEDLTRLEKLLDHAAPLRSQLGAPVHFRNIDVEAHLIFGELRLKCAIISGYAL